METEDHLEKQLLEAFGTKNLYEILGIDRTADVEAINRAYKRLALRFHPDRRGGDAVKFKAMSAAHSVLVDPAKRALYDNGGELNADDISDDEVFWYNYFRQLYPALTISAIETFAEKYRGSDEEREDVIASYLDHDGDLSKMMECIMCAEEGDEARICELIDRAIENGDIEMTAKYRSAKAKVSKGSKLKKRKSEFVGKEVDDPDALAMAILANRNNSSHRMASIVSKYASADDLLDDDIPDELFESARGRVMKQAVASNGKRKKKK